MEVRFPLTELEREYRALYETAGEILDNRAMTAEEYESAVLGAGEVFTDLLREPNGLSDGFESVLEEASFFTVQEDISTVRHIRYMPAVYHTSEFFELECVLSGRITCWIDGRRLALSPGDVLILAPQTSHAACVFSEDGIMVNLLVRRSTFEERFLNLLPASDLLRTFFENALLRSPASPYLLFATSDPEFLSTRILRILEESRRGLAYRNTALAALLQMFFVELLRKHEKDVIIPTISERVMNEDTIFMLQYMQKNIATITLSHLAAFFNYSERQMQRRIKAATGMSFVENIRTLRMRRAAELLTGTNMTVADIAEYLGYYDDSSFRHAFRDCYGVSPAGYRQDPPADMPPALGGR